MQSFIDIFKAFFLGLKEGFTDLVNWNKPPREKPFERDDSSWKKYFIYSEWRFWMVREVTAQIVVVLALLIIIREGIGEFRFIPSESMEPTLQIGDKLFVEKFTKIFRAGNYNRGDIVIFYPPSNATQGQEVIKNDPFSIFARLTGLPFFPQPEAYIKRIIGIPGDKVQIKKHLGVFINGRTLSEPYLFGSIDFLPEYDSQPVAIPEGYYLVLGDNRNQSSDGHIWGLLPKDRIIGRAAFIIYRSLDEKPKLR